MNKLLKDLRECSGCGFDVCRKAIEYCKTHKDCSPLAYLMIMYSGVKYGDIDKAIKEETKRLLNNPPYWAKNTQIYEVIK